MTTELAEKVTASLRTPGDGPLLHGLTESLAESVWRDLYRQMRITPSDYSTSRVLARNVLTACETIAIIPVASGNEDSKQAFQVEILGEDAAQPYTESGVRFLLEKEIKRAKMIERIAEAVNFIKQIPILFTIVAALVRSIHIIDAGDDDYDVSFSEPHIPFSIFISVPVTRTPIGTLRVSEAIIHETTHLQLALVERVTQLVHAAGRLYYSPWRQEFRSAQGILHALYVFLTVDVFYRELQQRLGQKDKAESDFIDDRRAEIHDQIGQLTTFQDSKDLTEVGTDFVRRLFSETQKR